MHSISKTQYLLASFKFDTMRAREEAISESHATSFKWLYSQQVGFTEWLRGNSDLYWITGKAGSGKSTLMKYTFENPRTHEELQKWSRGKKLVVSRYFFWNPGTKLQKSYLGLLRSLCYDVFRTCPDLLPVVLKERWSSLHAARCIQPDVFHNENWSQAELSKIIDRFGHSNVESDGRPIRLCFFIDGLDEYQGQHDDIIKALVTLARRGNIKSCVSSRPWNVFGEAFGSLSQSRRMLVLQDQTRDDISLYVRERLEHNPNFISVKRREPRCSDLVLEITKKADGVFLWVFLVINELLKSLTNAGEYHSSPIWSKTS